MKKTLTTNLILILSKTKFKDKIKKNSKNVRETICTTKFYTNQMDTKIELKNPKKINNKNVISR